MNFLIILKVALRSLRRTMLRSGLTVLGIVVGVAAVIAMVSIGNGARLKMESFLARMDSNRISVWALPPRKWWSAGNLKQLEPGDGLTVADRDAILRDVPGIALSGITMNGTGVTEVRGNGRHYSVVVQGIDIGSLDVYRFEVLHGAGFGQTDIEAARSVCLISQYLAEKLFGTADPVGRRVRVGDFPLDVIGVTKNREGAIDALTGEAHDTTVALPYTSVLRRINPREPIGILVEARDPRQLDAIKQGISDVLERRRGKRRAEFDVSSDAAMVQALKESSSTTTLLLGAIGGISLLVGGIGIMNIMLVSVTERTREIGIRLAIGTRGRDVLRQFLIESIVLSAIGGIMGIVLGIGVAKLMTSINGWATVVTPGSVAVAFLCSAAIGVFFGFYPARQAARLDPIQALRAE